MFQRRSGRSFLRKHAYTEVFSGYNKRCEQTRDEKQVSTRRWSRSDGSGKSLVAPTGEAELAAPRRSDRRSDGGRDSSWIGEDLLAAALVFGFKRKSLWGELSYVIYNFMK